MRKEYDFLLVGAGLFNAVFAYQARQQGKRCLVIDKRPHVGGNLYCEDIEGIHVHRYGPHIFHTSNKQVWDFVNKFVSFNRFTLCPVANYKGRIFNLPFNMNTFYQMWGTVTPAEACEKIRQQSASFTGSPQNLEEYAIQQVGTDIYQTLIKGYTEKQWGRSCKELPPSIIQRIPVRYTYDNNYFRDNYQGVPVGGYNRLMNGLLKGIQCLTRCNYFENKSHFDELADKIVYSGSIDEYFGYCIGKLDYRSLTFEDEIIQAVNYQGNAMVNYTDSSVSYTRIIEHKHFDISNSAVLYSPISVITREHPVCPSCCCDPYYPICDQKNTDLYEEYLSLSKHEPTVIFGGRLGQYRYMNMDETIASALSAFSNIRICDSQ